MAPKNWDVVVVGELFTDEILADFHALPKLGEESFARRFKREIGGGAAITAVGLAKLGVRVAILGSVGSDGDWITHRLESYGVDAGNLIVHPKEPTGLTVSVSTREDRAFFSYYGANDLLAANLRNPKWLSVMSKARHVHIAASPDGELDIKLMPFLRRRGCRISIDVQSNMSWLVEPSSLTLLHQADMFFPNEREAEWVSGETGFPRILRGLREQGMRGVGLKLGGKGAALSWGKEEYLVDPVEVTTVDTTGAGDCFNAGFIYAWLHKKAPQRCLETANLCGALSTRELGGLDGFPSLPELSELLKERKTS